MEYGSNTEFDEMMPDPPIVTKIVSVKGILALSIIGTYCFMWSYAIYTILATPTTTTFDPMQFLLEFAGATGVMGMIVILVVQNYFRKTEAQ